MAKVIVLGELCEDILLHSPASIEVMGQKIWAKDILITAGGSTFYTGATFLHLGAEVDLYSAVGDDDSGQRLLDMLNETGLGHSSIQILPGQSTTKSIVVCDGGEKKFIGCSPMLQLPLPTWDKIQDAKLIYIAGYTLYPELWSEEMLTLCQNARQHGIRIAMDSQLLPVQGHSLTKMSRLDQILPTVDLFFAARKEALELFGTDDPCACFDTMRSMNFDGLLILKRGQNGCYLINKDSLLQVPAFSVTAYDTVGSGDIFGGSFCWAWLQGYGHRQCARFAAAYTALCLGEYSVRKHFPSAAEAEKLLLNKHDKGVDIH